MSMVSVQGRVLRWGNSYGLRLSKFDVERLRLKPDTTIDVKVDVSDGPRLKAHEVVSFDLGGDASARHDELFGQGAVRDLEGPRRQGGKRGSSL